MKKGLIVLIVILVLLGVLAGGLVYLDPFGWFAADPAAMVTEPTQPATEAPTEAAPTEPAPTEPEPTEPAPTEPEPTEPPFQMEVGDEYSKFLYGREMKAGEYFVYDLDQERFLVRTGDVDERVYPASITKLYAAYVALQYLDPEETITVGSELWMVEAGSSLADLKIDDKLTVRQLIAGMLLPSGNDAAHTVAVTAGRKLAEDSLLHPSYAVDRFVKQMNEDMDDLGLTGSHFVTPDGMHSGNHYISFQDMVTIGKLALSNEVISQCVGVFEMELDLSESRTLEWENTNMLLDPDSRYYSPYIAGMKTGFTTPAGNCVLSYAQINQRNFLVGVFECKYPEDRFADTLLLLMRVLQQPVPAP
jgi:D-alanyl-D-alanine carboxypeptidase